MFDMLKQEVCNNILYDFMVLTNKMSCSMLWSSTQDVKPFMWLFTVTLSTTMSPRSTWVLKQKGSSRTCLILIPVSLQCSMRHILLEFGLEMLPEVFNVLMYLMKQQIEELDRF